MLLFLYDLAWTLVLIFSLPLLTFSSGRRLADKLGLRLPHNHSKKRNIWIHALSVGEVISSLPLITAITERYPSRTIALTVKTSQGMKIARDKLSGKVDMLVPMPLDFWWSARRIIRYVNPSVFILLETDIWPGLLSLLKRKGVKAVLVNGRISPGTFRSYRRYGFFMKQALNSLEECLMQTDLDTKRLREVGLKINSVTTVGNIKFDRSWIPLKDKERDYWTNLMNFGPGNRIWVAGSTHPGEDEILLDTFEKLIVHFPELRLIIAPRRPERAHDICLLCRAKGFEVLRRTEAGGNGSSRCQVMILDSMGELSRVYGIADVSFVGGSMVPFGGHNLLEPAGLGCPVLFGRHTHNFVRMAQLLIDAGGGKRVKDADDLFFIMNDLLSDNTKLAEMAFRAKKFVGKNRGALERVMDRIGGYIEAS